MTRAVDANVLFDILADGPHFERSNLALRRAADDDSLVICDIVYVEIGTHFRTRSELDLFLHETHVAVVEVSSEAMFMASQAWRAYTARRPDGFACAECGAINRPTCKRCNNLLRARQRVVADFLIGAHAMVDTDGLITRDTRYFKTYFPALTLL